MYTLNFFFIEIIDKLIIKGLYEEKDKDKKYRRKDKLKFLST